MKIGEALQEIKQLQSKLSRVQESRVQLFEFVKGHESGKSLDEFTEEIEEIFENIFALKLAVQIANIENSIEVSLPDGGSDSLSIMHAILKVSQYRSELAQLSKMYLQKPSYSYGKEQVVEYFQPMSEEEREGKITELENLKKVYDLAIQAANWTYDIKLDN